MTKTIQHLRGTTAQNDAFTGAAGEITVDTTTNELRLHDGSTAGGHVIPNKNFLGGGAAGTLLTNSGTPGTVNSTSIDATPTDSSTNPVSSGGVYTGLAGKANKDLDNLTSTGQNIGNWSSNVTNCITNIPQDIKLELNNGTLTLKAGSKVYMPNGVDTFDVITIASDLTIDGGSGSFSGSGTLYYHYTNSSLAWYASVADASGTTPPATSNFYNTSTNTVYRYRNNVQGAQLSFPLAHITVTNDVITSIDQVFNGSGHIGTAVFMLPGISALIPNGLNSDGSCKNIAFTNPSVYVYNNTTAVERNVGVITNSTGTIINYENSETKNTFVGLAQNRPTTVANTQNNWWYSTDENQWYNTSGSTTANWQKVYPVFLGKRNGTTTSTTYFEQKSAFSATDKNDREYIAHQAMPSNKYLDLTLPASGGSIIAPADGYVTLNKTPGAANLYIQLSNTSNAISITATSYNATLWTRIFIPVSKGDTVSVNYSFTGSTNYFRFVYANGAV